ncbi:MAG: DUF1638 domain-containing protein [Betaproteobacteria bacterium]
MKKKTKICLVSCSVLKRELQNLVKEGKLDAELVFVSKNFHVDYTMLETNLRKVLEHTKKRSTDKIILVYGDLCLGTNGEMKKLAEKYGVAKIDALNCIDCQLGGKGAFEVADPEHHLMFMGPGMIEFFKDMKANLLQQGFDESSFAGMFSGVEGFVILDTCGDGEKWKAELAEIGMGVPVIETRKIGCGGVLSVVADAINHA